MLTVVAENPTDCAMYRIDVNHTWPLARHLAHASLDEVDELVLKSFFPPDQKVGKETVEYRLIQTGFAATTKEVREEIAGRRLLPADLFDTLAFAGRFPGKQYQFDVAALGDPCRKGNDEYILVLGSRPAQSGDRKIRTLDVLNTSCLVWHPDCRFLCRVA